MDNLALVTSARSTTHLKDVCADVYVTVAVVADLEKLFCLCEETDWFIGQSILLMWLQYYSQGFFVARKHDGIIGCILCHHDDEDAFVGLWLVRTDHRGQGIGRELWRRMLSFAGERNIGLNTNKINIPLYHRQGFTNQGQGQSVTVFATSESISRQLATLKLGILSLEDEELIEIQNYRSEELDELVTYDGIVYGKKRKDFMIHWLDGPAVSCAFLAKQGNETKGYVVARSDQAGYLDLGPLYADSTNIFVRLLDRILKYMINEEIHCLAVDINSGSSAAMGVFTNQKADSSSLSDVTTLVPINPVRRKNSSSQRLQFRRSSQVAETFLQERISAKNNIDVVADNINQVSDVYVQLFTEKDCEVDWRKVYCFTNTEMMPC